MTRAPATTDAQDYISGMSRHVSSVCVITTAHKGHWFCLTATAVSSVSAAPPRLLVCVNTRTESHDHILTAGLFCVNVLAEEHMDIARRFGGMDRSDTGKFDHGVWDTMPSGAPRILDAVAAFDCRIAETSVHGTHSVIFGDVLHVETSTRTDALLYGVRQFQAASPIQAQPLSLQEREFWW